MAQTTYVKGTIRKDAVAIIPKDCRATEARVLEHLYGGGWVPASLRAVEVGELPHPAEELARLEALYGAETVEKAYGHAATARQAIAEILAMTPAKVKASGLLVENDAVPLVIEGEAPKAAKASGGKGGKAAASVDSGGESAPAAE